MNCSAVIKTGKHLLDLLYGTANLTIQMIAKEEKAIFQEIFCFKVIGFCLFYPLLHTNIIPELLLLANNPVEFTELAEIYYSTGRAYHRVKKRERERDKKHTDFSVQARSY